MVKLQRPLVEQGLRTALHHKWPLGLLKDTLPVASTPQPVLETVQSSNPASFRHILRCLRSNAFGVNLPQQQICVHGSNPEIQEPAPLVLNDSPPQNDSCRPPASAREPPISAHA